MGGVRSACEEPVTGPTGHKRGTMKEEIQRVLEARGALLLKDLYSLLPAHSKPSIRGVVYKMVNAGILEKTPEGKYRLKESREPAGSESGEGESGAKTLEKRVEQIWVKPNKNMSHLCHLSKNLYNEANYLIRQEFINNRNYIGYNDLDKMLNGSGTQPSENYKLLPSGTAQYTLKLLDRAWRGFFKAIKDWRKNPEKYKTMPKLPKYKKKGGEHIAGFTNIMVRIKDGYLYFPKKTNLSPVKTRLPDDTNLREVRIIPKGVGYVVEIVYKKEVDIEKEENDRVVGIDIGLKNIVAIANNIGLRPIVVKGGIIKSMNQYYNKMRAKLKSIYDRQGIEDGEKLKRLSDKRHRKIKDYFHKLSRGIVQYAKDNEIGNIFIGYNKDWKQRVSIGKKNIRKVFPKAFLRGRADGIEGVGHHPASLSADEMLEITRF